MYMATTSTISSFEQNQPPNLINNLGGTCLNHKFIKFNASELNWTNAKTINCSRSCDFSVTPTENKWFEPMKSDESKLFDVSFVPQTTTLKRPKLSFSIESIIGISS